MKNRVITVQNIPITISDADISTWEEIYNPDFKVFESEHLKKQAGLLTFTPSVSEWIEQTNAKGLFVKKG